MVLYQKKFSIKEIIFMTVLNRNGEGSPANFLGKEYQKKICKNNVAKSTSTNTTEKKGNNVKENHLGHQKKQKI